MLWPQQLALKTMPMLLFFANMLLCLYKVSSTTTYHKLTLSQPLQDGNGTTLVSTDGTFVLGFFTRGSSGNRHVGIWYRNIPENVVWVANRENSTRDNSSVLLISQDGNLVLISANGTLLWSTMLTTKASSPVVQLLDNGNLILMDNKDNNFLWQSFDHPCDTLLPGMKLRWNRKTGVNTSLTAWKNWDDPSPGNLSWGIMPSSDPELVLRQGSLLYHRSGPWNGLGFKALASQRNNYTIPTLLNDSNEVSYTFALKDESMAWIYVVNQTQLLRLGILLDHGNKKWNTYHTVPRDKCDIYNHCGPYAKCDGNSMPECQCLQGFRPKLQRSWELGNFTQGCVPLDQQSCQVRDRDGFNRFPWLKPPYTVDSWFGGSMTLEDCRDRCLKNCSCRGYTNINATEEGTSCLMWFGGLVDLIPLEGEHDLYVRMAVQWPKPQHKKRTNLTIIVTIISMTLVLLAIISYICWTRKKYQAGSAEESGLEDFELPIFDLATIVKATNNFSIDNKLGQGGYGPVYKGTLANGQEIAVKRLLKSSAQGINEFKSEVILCAKLQHRNLVKVVGYCVEGEEKMLAYEYMSNKSLDSFIFDSAQSKFLDWQKRFHIISSIARGLVYLHQDSRLKIIHRDLKASNILLDSNMNPKISDFGLARMCRDDEDEANTKIVIGTYGYMAPEYLFDGLFSTKSDVFSFGVLVLEIISGMKNRGHTYPRQSHTLIGLAWRLWTEGNLQELIDDNLRDSCVLSEVVRCIHVGLLCLQHHPDERPNIASVTVMLSSEDTLPQPKEPAFLVHEGSIAGESIQTTSSIDRVTISSADYG